MPVRISILLLVLTTVALLGAVSWPRTGQAVMLAFPAGAALAPAVLAEDWRVIRMRGAGPVILVVLAPETPASDPFSLRRRTGALLATLSAGQAGCVPFPLQRALP